MSLCEHSLTEIPVEVYNDPAIAPKLRVLDLSKNKLGQTAPKSKTSSQLRLKPFVGLKTLNLDSNMLGPGSLDEITFLSSLQNLSISDNQLGQPYTSPAQSATMAMQGLTLKKTGKQPNKQQTLQETTPCEEGFPKLPITIRQLNLSKNHFSYIPSTILSMSLTKLEKLDLSFNRLGVLPDSIGNLTGLEELKLDENCIVSLPSSIGKLLKLKALSLKCNRIEGRRSLVQTEQQQKQEVQDQPLPKELFTDTKLIDLNLAGNLLTNTQLNEFEGYEVFLDRRQKVKSKLMWNLDTCGLE